MNEGSVFLIDAKNDGKNSISAPNCTHISSRLSATIISTTAISQTEQLATPISNLLIPLEGHLQSPRSNEGPKRFSGQESQPDRSEQLLQDRGQG